MDSKKKTFLILLYIKFRLNENFTETTKEEKSNHIQNEYSRKLISVFLIKQKNTTENLPKQFHSRKTFFSLLSSIFSFRSTHFINYFKRLSFIPHFFIFIHFEMMMMMMKKKIWSHDVNEVENFSHFHTNIQFFSSYFFSFLNLSIHKTVNEKGFENFIASPVLLK